MQLGVLGGKQLCSFCVLLVQLSVYRTNMDVLVNAIHGNQLVNVVKVPYDKILLLPPHACCICCTGSTIKLQQCNLVLNTLLVAMDWVSVWIDDKSFHTPGLCEPIGPSAYWELIGGRWSQSNKVPYFIWGFVVCANAVVVLSYSYHVHVG